MDSSNKFQLEIAIDNYLERLQLKGNYTPEDIAELKSHLFDNVDALKHLSLDDEEAFLVAKKRLGKEEELETEFNKVNVGFGNQWIFFFLGIAMYIVGASLYTIEQNYLIYLVRTGKLDGTIAIWGESIFQITIAIIIFRSARKLGSMMDFFKQKLIKHPVLVSTLILIVVSGSMFFSFNGYQFFYGSGTINIENYNAYYGSRKWSIILPYIIPLSFLLMMFSVFYRAVSSRRFSFNHLLKTNNFFFFLAYGFCFEVFAAMTRMIGTAGIINSLYFAIVYAIGVFSVVYFSSKNTAIKLFLFCLTGFCIELWGSFINEKLRYGTPVSIFLYALLGALIVGVLAGKFFKQSGLATV